MSERSGECDEIGGDEIEAYREALRQIMRDARDVANPDDSFHPSIGKPIIVSVWAPERLGVGADRTRDGRSIVLSQLKAWNQYLAGKEIQMISIGVHPIDALERVKNKTHDSHLDRITIMYSASYDFLRIVGIEPKGIKDNHILWVYHDSETPLRKAVHNKIESDLVCEDEPLVSAGSST